MYARPYIMRVACPDRNKRPIRSRELCYRTVRHIIIIIIIIHLYFIPIPRVCASFFVSLIKKRAHMGDILLSTTTSPGDISSLRIIVTSA